MVSILLSSLNEAKELKIKQGELANITGYIEVNGQGLRKQCPRVSKWTGFKETEILN